MECDEELAYTDMTAGTSSDGGEIDDSWADDLQCKRRAPAPLQLPVVPLMPSIPGSGIPQGLKDFMVAAMAEERAKTDVKLEKIQTESLAVLENDRNVAAAAAVLIQQQIAAAVATSVAATDQAAAAQAATQTQLERILSMLAAPTAAV